MGIKEFGAGIASITLHTTNICIILLPSSYLRTSTSYGKNYKSQAIPWYLYPIKWQMQHQSLKKGTKSTPLSTHQSKCQDNGEDYY